MRLLLLFTLLYDLCSLANGSLQPRSIRYVQCASWFDADLFVVDVGIMGCTACVRDPIQAQKAGVVFYHFKEYFYFAFDACYRSLKVPGVPMFALALDVSDNT